MKKILPIVLILLLAFSTMTACETEDTSSTSQEAVGTEVEETTVSDEQEPSSYPQYDVVRVVDGDTIVISYNGVDEKVRMIGVDTPESVHPDKTKNTEFGDTVSQFSKSELGGKSVGIEFDVQERDQYGRLLAYVYVGDKMYNKTLLEKGYASVSTYPPNVKYVDDFTALQKKAREDGVGMWAAGFSATNNSSSSSSSGYKGHIKNKKFHQSGCRYGEMITDENLIVFDTRDKALNEGYAACKVCKP